MRSIYVIAAGTLLTVFVVILASTHSPADPKAAHVQLARKALAIFPGGRQGGTLRMLNLTEGPLPQTGAQVAARHPEAAHTPGTNAHKGKNNTAGGALHPRTSKKGGAEGKYSPAKGSVGGVGGITRKDTSSKATEAEIQELLSQVARDLEPWKESGISLEMVEKVYCMESVGESARFQVVDGKLYIVGEIPIWQSRGRMAQLQLLKLQRTYQLPDVDFMLTTSDKCKAVDGPVRSHDGNQTRCEKHAPIFACDKLKWESQCVLAPDWSFGGWPEAFLESWEVVSPWLSAAADARPWEKRHKPVYWRGGDTSSQRKIMHDSEKVQTSGLTDVRLMSWGDGPEEFKNSFKSLTEHCDYRHLLHLTGVAYSARLKYLMLCGSAVIFPQRGDWEYREFWYHLLKDRENILLTGEVNWDNWGDPVLDAMKEVQANETWARSMGAAAKHLATEVLHPDNVARYWMELLAQYSALQTFKPKLHADAQPLEESLLRPPRHREIWERTCAVC